MISVVICHHKGDFIHKAVQTVKASIGVDLEIIVVSSEESLKIDGVKILHKTGEPAAKRNLGVLHAKGNFIAFFDDDVELVPNAIYEMQKLLISNEKIGMVYGKTKNMEFRNRFDAAGSFITRTGFLYAREQSGIEDKGQFDEVCPIMSSKSASCMVRKSVFNEVHGFDEDFGILGEETDLSWRIWLRGYQVLWCPSSVIYHAFNTIWKPMDYYSHKRVYLNGCRNYMTMLVKNFGLANLLIALPCQLVAWLLSAIGMALSRKPKAGLYIFLGVINFIKVIPKSLAKRRAIQKHRKVSDKSLMSKVMYNPPFSYFLKRFFRYFKVGLHG